VKYIKYINDNTDFTKSKLFKLIGISSSRYYSWRNGTVSGERAKKYVHRSHYTTEAEKQAVINYVKNNVPASSSYIRDGYRRLAYKMIDENICYLPPSTVYRILRKEGLLNEYQRRRTTGKSTGFQQPTRPHEHWHTDIKYVNFKGTFLFFISVIDGYSRYILHHEICTSMSKTDVAIVIQRAKELYPDSKARLITDNGGQYISKEFGLFIKEIGLTHVKTSPSYPQSNGKIERMHRSLNEECLRKTYFINQQDAEQTIQKYVDYYNNKRLHSSLKHLRPIDYLKGNYKELLAIREFKLSKGKKLRAENWKQSEEKVA